MNLFFLLGLGPSQADSVDVDSMRRPSRCDAVFVAPNSEQCQMDGTWAAASTARNGSKAKEQALARLEETVQLEIQIRLGLAKPENQEMLLPLLTNCTAVAMEEAQVYCAEDEELTNRETCYASFTDESCWKGVGIEIQEKPNWRAKESGRTEICLQVDTWMIEHNVDETKRMQCQVSCLQNAKVNCREF